MKVTINSIKLNYADSPSVTVYSLKHEALYDLCLCNFSTNEFIGLEVGDKMMFKLKRMKATLDDGAFLCPHPEHFFKRPKKDKFPKLDLLEHLLNPD